MLGGILAFMGFGAKEPARLGFARETHSLTPSPTPSGQQSNGVLSRAPARRVLMLDIDGVLHPAQAGSLIYLPLLEAWLRAHKCVDVVVSSNWKNTHTVEQLRRLFSVDLRDRVLGTTPDCRGVREDEILALVERYDIELWAAVDDRGEGFPTTAAMHLAMTEYFDGLVPATFTRLAWILQL